MPNAVFEMAQALRRSHCDQKDDKSHECVGEVTIKRGEVCLDCKLCGKGGEIPGWNHFTAKLLEKCFEAAGINWGSLGMEARLAAVIAHRREMGQQK